jgi:hypothetical protein
MMRNRDLPPSDARSAIAAMRTRSCGIRLAGGSVLTILIVVLLPNGLPPRAAEVIRRLPPITVRASSSLSVTSPSLAALHVEQATAAAAFVDSMGVQTHISYIDTPYGNWQGVMNELVRLGVRHVRDALPLTPTFVKNHQQLAAAGIRCTCGFAIDKEIAAEQIVQAAHAASDVEALEAPNECDAGSNCGGGGKAGIAHAVNFLPVLASAARTLGVPTIGPSFTTAEAYSAAGPIGQWVAFNNLHVYFGGRNPGTDGWGAGDAQGHRYGSMDWWIDQSRLNAPGVPLQITETGYESFDRPVRPGTIATEVESSYLLRTLLLAWSHGIRRTFVYELLDESPDSGYGLLRHDLTEKPAFRALRNLLEILHDSSSPTTLGGLSFSVDGTDPSLSHVLLQKSDGSYYLILWLERSGYDGQSLEKTPVPSESVQIRLEPRFAVSRVITFNENGSIASQDLSGSSSLPLLRVSDRLSVLRIVAN